MMNILVNWSTLEVHFPLAQSGDKIKLNSFKIGSLIFQLVWCKTLQYFIIKCVEQNKIHWCSHFFPSLSSRPNIRPKKYCGCVNTPKKKIKALICFFIFSFFSASFDGNKKRHCIQHFITVYIVHTPLPKSFLHTKKKTPIPLFTPELK